MNNNKTYNPNDYFEYQLILAKNIVSSQKYQRNIKQKSVEGIVEDFDPYQVNPLKIAYRDGKNYLFNGQHTLTSIITKFGNCVYVPCLVFKQITPEMEARLFAEQDDHNRALTCPEKLKAKYYEGKTEVIVFHNMCEKYGYICDFDQQQRDKKISSYSYLYNNIFVARGLQRLEDILSIISFGYKCKKGSTTQNVLRALNCFLDFFESDGCSLDRLKDIISQVEPSKIRTRQKELLNAGGKLSNDAAFAEVIREKYNNGLRNEAKMMPPKYFR